MHFRAVLHSLELGKYQLKIGAFLNVVTVGLVLAALCTGGSTDTSTTRSMLTQRFLHCSAKRKGGGKVEGDYRKAKPECWGDSRAFHDEGVLGVVGKRLGLLAELVPVSMRPGRGTVSLVCRMV
jgi:hypothetical protein